MKLFAARACLFVASLALSSVALAGEVEISLRGEVELNLTSGVPSKGSAVEVRLRVETPGFSTPGGVARYQVVPASLSVHLEGVGATQLVGPTLVEVHDAPTSDRVVLPSAQVVGAAEATADLRLDPATWGTPDLTLLEGTYTSAIASSVGNLVDPSTFIEFSFHTLEISAPSAGTTICEPAEPNSTGYPTHLTGAFTAPGGGLHVDADDGPPGQVAIVVVGPAAMDPGAPLGDGRLCIAPAGGVGLGRYSVGPLSSLGQFDAAGRLVNQSGTSSTGFGFDVPTELPYAGLPPILPGDTWHFQIWHRDIGNTSNLTNGLTVVF